MKKLITILLLITISGVSSPLFAESSKTPSKYASQIEACIKANKAGTAKNIQDYVCPSGTLHPQEIAFQVIMSLEFNAIDKEVEAVLATIYAGGNKDVGKLTTTIKKNFDTEFPAKYRKVCDEIVREEALLYFGSISTDYGTVDFTSGQTKCTNRVKTKIESYKQSAWLLGESAIVKSFLKDKHTYMRKLKDQYEKFLNKWSTYVGQLSVIRDKWTTKTEKTRP